jgi:hypothetical protein
VAKRSNLIIVRAGDDSLHEAWLEGAAERDWDVIVSYFGATPGRYESDDVRVIDAKGAKWPPLGDVVKELDDNGTLDDYEYICLPDDDIRTDAATLNRLFGYCAQYNLTLAQPALTEWSYFSWPFTRRDKGTTLRWVNIIEAMTPVFRRDLMRKVYPEFTTTLSGWGHDAWWASLVEDKEGGMAVIDAAAVTHTRPVGGPNYDVVRAAGTTPERESADILARKGIAFPKFHTYGYVDRYGNGIRHPRVLDQPKKVEHELNLWIDAGSL